MDGHGRTSILDVDWSVDWTTDGTDLYFVFVAVVVSVVRHLDWSTTVDMWVACCFVE